MIGPDAFAAQDTLAQIPDNKGICLFKGFVIGHGIKIRFANAQLCRDPSQLAAVSFAADNARFRVFRHHQADDIATVFGNAFGGGLDNHILGCRGNTGGHEAAALFIFHQTQAAGAKRL
jgi:hypothetical protein